MKIIFEWVDHTNGEMRVVKRREERGNRYNHATDNYTKSLVESGFPHNAVASKGLIETGQPP